METQSKTPSPLLVTGATGYLASHLIKILLEKGYKVRGTVRSLAKKEKYEFLYSLVPEKKNNLELVEADLTDKASWPRVIEGVEYVFHIASPISASVPKDEMEIITPAVEGTLNVLEAAVEKKVKKVIVTSSCLAIFLGNNGKLCTEDDWGNEAIAKPYPKSKILAEKAAWDFYEKNKDKIDITVVNPALILGPQFTKHGNSSETLIAEMLRGVYPGVMNVGLCFVDVRDAAEAHYKAMFTPGTTGKRYICTSGVFKIEEIVGALKSEFEKYGYKINDKKVTAEEVKASGVEVAQIHVPLINNDLRLNNERGIKELGLKYHTLKEMVVDMGYSLIKQGVVEDKTGRKKN